MASPDFLVANFWYIVLIVFLIGTALLTRTKFQRYLILFMIRTRHGIRFLDSLANLSPRGWKSLADFSVIVSFGGLGATYVSRHRNPSPFLLVMGIISLLFLYTRLDYITIAALFTLLLISTAVLYKKNSVSGSFVLGSLIVAGMILGLLGFTTSSLVVAIITGVFGIPGLLVSFLSVQASQILLQESTVPGVSPLIPGISSAGEIGFIFPGLDIFIPLWSGLIAIIVLLVSHEFSHGIQARVHGIKVRSMGLLTFGILPIGAFVEPDEKQIEKKKTEEKMRVYTMGSFANIIVAVIASLLLVGLGVYASGMIDAVGVEIVSVEEGLPAEVLEPGTIITSINGAEVTTVDEYIEAAATLSPGDTITLGTDKGVFSLVSVAPPDGEDRAYLGFSLHTKTELKESLAGQEFSFSVLMFIISTLGIIYLFNLNIAFVNLLPVLPFDGYKMFEELMKSFNMSKESRKRVIKYVVLIIVALLLLNALPLGGLVAGAI